MDRSKQSSRECRHDNVGGDWRRCGWSGWQQMSTTTTTNVKRINWRQNPVGRCRHQRGKLWPFQPVPSTRRHSGRPTEPEKRKLNAWRYRLSHKSTIIEHPIHPLVHGLLVGVYSTWDIVYTALVRSWASYTNHCSAVASGMGVVLGAKTPQNVV